MSTKQINTRIQHKTDTISNWEKAKNFIPLKGELIIFTSDEKPYDFLGIKIGNETNYLHELPFISLGGGSEAIDEIDPDSLDPVTSRAIYTALSQKARIQFITWEDED